MPPWVFGTWRTTRSTIIALGLLAFAVVGAWSHDCGKVTIKRTQETVVVMTGQQRDGSTCLDTVLKCGYESVAGTDLILIQPDQDATSLEGVPHGLSASFVFALV